MELAKQLRGDYVLDGKVNKTGTGGAVRLETRILTRSGQQTLAQPLPAIDGKDVGDAAKQIEKVISEALKGVPGYKLCKKRSTWRRSTTRRSRTRRRRSRRIRTRLSRGRAC